MYQITFVSSLLSLTILITHAHTNGSKPIIAVIQGVIENENLLPVSIFWYHPNFTEGDWLFVHYSNNIKKYTNYFKIESYTGFYNLPTEALEHFEKPDEISQLVLPHITPFLGATWFSSENMFSSYFYRVTIMTNEAHILDEYCVEIQSSVVTFSNNPTCKSRSQWMYDRRDILQFFSLRDLIIPGTHQSAAYAKSDNESLNDQSLISRWTLCQTKSIKTQLMDGIRYLDLRPGFIYIDGKKKYILTHNVFNLVPVDDAVEQINEFMDISKDIVIVSFREFRKGFNSDEDHLSLMNYLENSFRVHAHPRRLWITQLNQFWTAGMRLVRSYDHDLYRKSDLFWPRIPQYWSDVQTIGRLHSHLNEIHRDYADNFEPYAAMVELTHSATTIVQDIFTKNMSLWHWAERLGRYIPGWYTEEWNSLANIIAVDFYQTSGIVDIAIQVNERRAEDSGYPYKKFKRPSKETPAD